MKNIQDNSEEPQLDNELRELLHSYKIMLQDLGISQEHNEGYVKYEAGDVFLQVHPMAEDYVFIVGDYDKPQGLFYGFNLWSDDQALRLHSILTDHLMTTGKL